MRVLVLDEPTEGIQPSVIQEIGRVITSIKQDIAVLLVEQYLEFALDIADEVYVIEKGEIVQQGTPETLDAEQLKETMAL